MAGNKITALNHLKLAVMRCYAASTSKISELSTSVAEAIEEIDATKADVGHTHNYAGSSTAGGAATKAIADRNGMQFDRTYCSMVPFGTAVATNCDLNTVEFMKVGNYYCSANTTVATLKNCPTTSAFMMQVFSPLSTTIDNESTKTWCYRLRKMLVYTGEEYIQHCYAGATAGSWTYGAWKKIINADDIGDINTILDTINGEEI